MKSLCRTITKAERSTMNFTWTDNMGTKLITQYELGLKNWFGVTCPTLKFGPTLNFFLVVKKGFRWFLLERQGVYLLTFTKNMPDL